MHNKLSTYFSQYTSQCNRDCFLLMLVIRYFSMIRLAYIVCNKLSESIFNIPNSLQEILSCLCQLDYSK